MPVSAQVDRAHGLLYVTAKGRLSIAELTAHQRTLEAHAEDVRGLHEIFDLTGCEGFDVSRADVASIQRQAGRRRTVTEPGRLAILAPTDLGYGLARMYEALAENTTPPREVMVFRDLAATASWLGLPVGWTPSGCDPPLAGSD